jgi:RNA-binding protein 39
MVLGRQALEAQRDDCTILVYRLHLDAREKDIFKFFAEANIGRIIDIKVIRDPRTCKPKGVAYVEFETQESVVLASALSGHQIYGKYFLGNNHYKAPP